MSVSGQGGAERREATLSRYEIDPDPKRVREVLAEVEASLGEIDAPVRRRVSLLVGELVGRISETDAEHGALHMDIHERPSSLRVDVWDEGGLLDDGFWRRVADSALVGLVSSWGRDRRRAAGAWFEVTHPQEGRSPRS